jgi:hypothetical protein
MRPFLIVLALLCTLLAGLASTVVLVQPPAVRADSAPGEFDALRAKGRPAAAPG